MTEERTTPPPMTAGLGGERLVAAVADRVGSAREARWIVEHAGGDQDLADSLASRRASGEPLQYVLGRWPFRSVELRVDRRVLIPRPETEEVVGVALDELRKALVAVGRRGVGPGLAVDLGTGSGAIALSLSVEGDVTGRGLDVWATDASGDALEVARVNLGDLAVIDPVAAARVHLARGSWFAALPSALATRIDLVVSNPPYVAESEYDHLDPVVREWEPRSSLVSATGAGGVGGMADIETIVAEAPRWLHRSGALVVELAPHQADAAAHAARRAGFDNVATASDLAGRPRMLVARR